MHFMRNVLAHVPPKQRQGVAAMTLWTAPLERMET